MAPSTTPSPTPAISMAATMISKAEQEGIIQEYKSDTTRHLPWGS